MRSGSGSEDGASSASDDDESSDSEELPPIAPLPPQALPEFYTKEAARARGEPPAEPPPLRRPPKPPAGDGEAKPRRKKARSGEGVAAPAAEAGEGGPRPWCAVCSLLFTSDAQLAEHLKVRRVARAPVQRPGLTRAALRGAQGKKQALKERAQRLGPNAPPPAPLWRPKTNPELQARACVARELRRS